MIYTPHVCFPNFNEQILLYADMLSGTKLITIKLLPDNDSGEKCQLRKSLNHNANIQLFINSCIIQSCNEPVIRELKQR